MALAISILLVAVGAVLLWAVTYEVAGVNIDVVGWIALAVGMIGVAFAMLTYARRPAGERTTRRDYAARP